MKTGQIVVAAFAVLAALIVVFLAAFIVWNPWAPAPCTVELHAQMLQLQNALQQAASGNAGISISVPLTLTQCPAFKTVGVRVTHYDDPIFCRSCLAKYGGCWKLEPLEYTVGRLVSTDEVTACVQLNANASLNDDSATNRACTPLSDNACPPAGSPGFNATCTVDHLESDIGCQPGQPASECHTLGDSSRQYSIQITRRANAQGNTTGPFIGICAQPA